MTKRWLLLLPCAFFIFAALELTAPVPNVGTMGAFGLDLMTPGLCVLAFFPFLLFLLVVHWFFPKFSNYRGIVYLVTALTVLTIVTVNLLRAPPYDIHSRDGTSIAAWIKGTADLPDNAGTGGYLAPDSTFVVGGLSLGFFLIALSFWDGSAVIRTPK